MANQLTDVQEEAATYFLTRDPWQAWTPTVTQSGAVTVTVTWARYAVLGNTVHLWVRLAVTGSGTIGNPIAISGIPAAIRPTNSDTVSGVIGTGIIFDTGTAFYQGAVIAYGTNELRFIAHNNGGYIGGSPSFALASGDSIGFQATYER